MNNLIVVSEEKFGLKVGHHALTIYKYETFEDEEGGNTKKWVSMSRYYPNNVTGLKHALHEIALQISYEEMSDVKNLINSLNKNLSELKNALSVFEGKIMVEGNKKDE